MNDDDAILQVLRLWLKFRDRLYHDAEFYDAPGPEAPFKSVPFHIEFKIAPDGRCWLRHNTRWPLPPDFAEWQGDNLAALAASILVNPEGVEYLTQEDKKAWNAY